MNTWKGICLDDHEIVDTDDSSKRFELRRGKEYTLSHEKDGQRCVLSRYWVWVPSEWFASLRPDCGDHSADGDRNG